MTKKWLSGSPRLKVTLKVTLLGGRFGNFLFFLLGGGEGGVQGDREGAGGFRFSLKFPGGRGGLPGGGWGGGREGMWREFASGAEMPAKPKSNPKSNFLTEKFTFESLSGAKSHFSGCF